MWIFTRDGFFSAVKNEYCEDGELMIRARWKADLEKLTDRIGRPLDVLKFAGTDYAFRAKVTRKEWTAYCSKTAEEVDYANVKGTIVHGDRERSRAYLGVWGALNDAQQRALEKATRTP